MIELYDEKVLGKKWKECDREGLESLGYLIENFEKILEEDFRKRGVVVEYYGSRYELGSFKERDV